MQVAYALRATTGSVEVEQRFPADLEHLAVIVRKFGDAKLTSPNISRQQEMPADGQVYIAAAGDAAIPAGQPITLNVTGLPHHSLVPRYVAPVACRPHRPHRHCRPAPPAIRGRDRGPPSASA